MISLSRAGDPVRWGEPDKGSAGPLTWRPVVPHPEQPKAFQGDLALCTCPNGHECRVSGNVHTVASDGAMSPSYVCPVDGCGFHEFTRLDGWTPEAG
jgi:hypothetical protein